MPANVFAYVMETSGWHQPVLVVLTIAIFLLELVPIELQRRIVNDLARHKDYRPILLLCAAYAGVVLLSGGAKLAMNVYRGWVGVHVTRLLRRRIRSLVGSPLASLTALEANGIEVSMIVAEVEPIGGFVGEAISEPLLQVGVLLSTLAYMMHVDLWMAGSAFVLFLPQIVLVPIFQKAINRRTEARIRLLREVSVGITAATEHSEVDHADGRIDRIFFLDMGIFRFRFTLNFIMNLFNHFQIIAILLLGGWLVYADRLAIGGVVAFISAAGRLPDPWGELVNYFRDLNVTQVKYRLVAGAVNALERPQGSLSAARASKR